MESGSAEHLRDLEDRDLSLGIAAHEAPLVALVRLAPILELVLLEVQLRIARPGTAEAAH